MSTKVEICDSMNMSNRSIFTDYVKGMNPEEMEEFNKTIVMHMDTPAASEIRCQYYKRKLRYMGENVRIGTGVRFVRLENISLGDNVFISDNCTLIATSEKGIELGPGTRLKTGVYLDTELSNGYITTGKSVYIGTGCCLHGHAGLEIGDDCLLAQNITITPASHTFERLDRTIYQQPCTVKKITIGKDCYLGMNVCVVCYAERIGDGSVIGAGSVVVKEIPPYSVAVGVPAKIIRTRK